MTARPTPFLAGLVCDHCGATRTEEEIELNKLFGKLHCIDCDREGCFECMPAGRGVICPQCEEH